MFRENNEDLLELHLEESIDRGLVVVSSLGVGGKTSKFSFDVKHCNDLVIGTL